MNSWYEIQNIEAIDSPALLIYEDRVKQNIDQAIKLVGDASRLRPHVKTHKCGKVALLQMQAGIQKFKCSTIAEAEMLAMVNAPDVLMAYQPTGPKLQRFINLVKKYPATSFSCLIDNAATAKQIAETALEHSLLISVFIDLNLGMNRTGILPCDAENLAVEINNLNGIQLKGLHAYDGHLHQSNFEERTLACNEAFTPVEQLQETLKKEGFNDLTIVAGGSPTFPIHAKRLHVECSPGTFVFWDYGYVKICDEQSFIPAALVISRIISIPETNTLCLDLGHKSVASENELSRRIYFINAPELTFKGHSEEHLLVNAPTGHAYKTGDVLYGIPHHVCPTVALYECALVVKDNKIADEWPINARNRKITI